MNVGSLFGGFASATFMMQSQSGNVAGGSNAAAGSVATGKAGAVDASPPVRQHGEHHHQIEHSGEGEDGGFSAFVTALAQALQQSGLTIPAPAAPAAGAAAPATPTGNRPSGQVDPPIVPGSAPKTPVDPTQSGKSKGSAQLPATSASGTPAANSGSASSSGTGSAAAGSPPDIGQALLKFAQDLFSVLNGQGQGGGDDDGDDDHGRDDGGVHGYHSLATALQGLLSALQGGNGSSTATAPASSNSSTPAASSGASASPTETLSATFGEATLTTGNGGFSLNITEISLTETFGANPATPATGSAPASSATGAVPTSVTGTTTPTAPAATGGTTSASAGTAAGTSAGTAVAAPINSALDQLKSDFAKLIAALQGNANSATTAGSTPSTPTSPSTKDVPAAGTTGTTSTGTSSPGTTGTGANPAGGGDIGTLLQSFLQNMLNDAQMHEPQSLRYTVGTFSVTA